MNQTLAIAEDAIRERRELLIGVVNAAKMVNMQRDTALRQSVLGSDLILADGMAVVRACRLLGRPLPERVAGIDLMEGLLRRSNRRGYRVFLLGATEAVLSAVVEQMRARYPGAQIVGCRNGYFDSSEEPAIVRQIREARPDILFLGMTSPKKERFLARWSAEMGVPLCHGVGGSFDVMAGKVRRAPRWWQRMGLEWLYRVLQEPRRMWKRYLVTNTWFTGLVLAEWFAHPRATRI
jgi:N-acetylglucosaminyldiphosphoundecaprenol N-acetyl-beta-D-mannosaminyltransferase